MAAKQSRMTSLLEELANSRKQIEQLQLNLQKASALPPAPNVEQTNEVSPQIPAKEESPLNSEVQHCIFFFGFVLNIFKFSKESGDAKQSVDASPINLNLPATDEIESFDPGKQWKITVIDESGNQFKVFFF